MKGRAQPPAAKAVPSRRRLHRHASAAALPYSARPPRWQRWAVHGSVLALVATGVAWLVAHYLLAAPPEAESMAPVPLEPWALRLHGIAAYAFLVVFGSLVSAHIVVAWRLRRNLVSGVSMVVAVLALGATALLLYYGPEAAHGVVGVAHWVVGFVLALVLWVHVSAARRLRQPQRGA
jgi:hypothetical protein